MGKWNYKAIPKVKTWSYFLTIPKFVEAENLKLNPPWDKEDINQLLNKISTHIRETQPDLLYKQCLEEMKKLVPDDDEDNRLEQVKNFIKCSDLLKLNEDEALEIIIKTCKKIKLITKWESVIIKFYKRLKDEATNKNEINVPSEEQGTTEGEEDNTRYKLPSLKEQYFTNWIRKSSSFIPISKYFSVKCLKS